MLSSFAKYFANSRERLSKAADKFLANLSIDPKKKRKTKAERTWEHVEALQQLLVEVFAEVPVGQSAVPIFHNVPAIHDLTEEVANVVPGHLDVVF